MQTNAPHQKTLTPRCLHEDHRWCFQSSTSPFRSFDLLKKRKINVSISRCALLDELRPSFIHFQLLSRYANKNTTLELGCQSHGHKHTDGSPWGYSPGDNLCSPITAVPVVDFGCNTRLSLPHRCNSHLPLSLHLPAYGARLSGHLTLIPLTTLCLWTYPLFSRLLGEAKRCTIGMIAEWLRHAMVENRYIYILELFTPT